MSATENVRLRSREHRVPLSAVRLLLGMTECQDPHAVPMFWPDSPPLLPNRVTSKLPVILPQWEMVNRER